MKNTLKLFALVAFMFLLLLLLLLKLQNQLS